MTRIPFPCQFYFLTEDPLTRDLKIAQEKKRGQALLRGDVPLPQLYSVKGSVIRKITIGDTFFQVQFFKDRVKEREEEAPCERS